jgi:tRNA-splicing ligase RtcB
MISDEMSLKGVFDQISRDVPVGRAHAQQSTCVRGGSAAICRPSGSYPGEASGQLLKSICGTSSKWVKQMGTLGGGNHFIEVCLDESNPGMGHAAFGQSRHWQRAGEPTFIQLARQDMERWMIHLPDRDLAYFPYFPEGTVHFDDYVEAVHWAQEYAFQNRQCMVDLVLEALRRHLPAFEVTSEVVNCHHNYVAQEHHYGADVWVTRKGAIRARQGDLGIIPGSMGARSYIVRGLGNPDSFNSSAHGAGRRMSRTAAEKQFTESDMVQQTEGVICRKDKGVIDEIPGAYKDIDAVMENQKDLTETLHTLKQVVCVKG